MPRVAVEPEGFRRGPGSYVYKDLNSRVKYDEITFEHSIVARLESCISAFLKNAEHPFLRQDNCVVMDVTTIRCDP